MKRFIKRLLCLHPSYAKAGWKLYSRSTNENWWVCKECGKLKNFGFSTSGWFAFENLPVNLDCTYETYYIKDPKNL